MLSRGSSGAELDNPVYTLMNLNALHTVFCIIIKLLVKYILTFQHNCNKSLKQLWINTVDELKLRKIFYSSLLKATLW